MDLRWAGDANWLWLVPCVSLARTRSWDSRRCTWGWFRDMAGRSGCRDWWGRGLRCRWCWAGGWYRRWERIGFGSGIWRDAAAAATGGQGPCDADGAGRGDDHGAGSVSDWVGE